MSKWEICHCKNNRNSKAMAAVVDEGDFFFMTSILKDLLRTTNEV